MTSHTLKLEESKGPWDSLTITATCGCGMRIRPPRAYYTEMDVMQKDIERVHNEHVIKVLEHQLTLIKDK